MPKLQWLSILLLGVYALSGFATASQAPLQRVGRRPLQTLQTLIGSWRGVGQVRRGSTQGAWVEEAEWTWRFEGDSRILYLRSPDSKYIREAWLSANDRSEQYELKVKLADVEQPVNYRGKRTETGAYEFQTETRVAHVPQRVTMRSLAGDKRLVILYERQLTEKRFIRMAEVGLTRKGSDFASETTFVECIVTGGKGTIPVTHEGKTYYVCCSGCRDYFNEQPAKVLAAYQNKRPDR